MLQFSMGHKASSRKVYLKRKKKTLFRMLSSYTRLVKFAYYGFIKKRWIWSLTLLLVWIIKKINDVVYGSSFTILSSILFTRCVFLSGSLVYNWVRLTFGCAECMFKRFSCLKWSLNVKYYRGIWFVFIESVCLSLYGPL